jgi:MFS family permease
MLGNVMEWYDFALFGYFVSYISNMFFPSENEVASLLATWGVFAGGFIMRPLGGGLFGVIGDRVGRCMVLLLSVVLMALPTFWEAFWAFSPFSRFVSCMRTTVPSGSKSTPCDRRWCRRSQRTSARPSRPWPSPPATE